MYTLIDTHAHIDMHHFDHDRDDVISRAMDNGVSRILTVGIDVKSSEAAIKLAETYKCIFASVGFHPHEAAKITQTDIRNLAQLAKNQRAVAIGEIGLDFYRNSASHQAQRQVMEWQLSLATETNLPVIIHSRQADDATIEVLEKWVSDNPTSNDVRGVIHCFNSSRAVAEKYIDLGFNISLGAYIGYPSSVSKHEDIKHIPLNRLLIETDSPFLPPQTHRGKRNEPALITATLNSLATIRGIPPEAVAKETTSNAIQTFRFQ